MVSHRETWTRGDHRPFMWVDLQNKAHTEIEYVNGKICRLGRMFKGLDVCANLCLTSSIDAVRASNTLPMPHRRVWHLHPGQLAEQIPSKLRVAGSPTHHGGDRQGLGNRRTGRQKNRMARKDAHISDGLTPPLQDYVENMLLLTGGNSLQTEIDFTRWMEMKSISSD